ncbi:MAG: glycoside hydrolase family 5 protein [Sphingobium sp.]|uniref:glycoside hydrolase family 5 protein n=1 Tax=Sphingobium sp. TaxID=1912891 RepID=UPI0029B8A4B7|nr:glycoside hydrolase family 5 protein [Sphingobium sp.]MDX3911231.1 glycoside hydrolase family 5 protein [Sphingobium sp.]
MRTRLSISLSCSALLLASCGGGGGGSPTAQPVTIPTPTPAAAAPPVTVPTPTPNSGAKVAFGYTLAPAAKPSKGNPLPLGKCVNMGGMLERDVEGDIFGRPIRDDDFRIIRAAGFDTIRLPVKYSAHTAAAAPYAIDPALMARVRHLVDTALATDLNIIIDLHHYTDVQKSPSTERDRFVAIWRQIAEAHQGDGPKVWFELLNEPGHEFWNKVSTWDIFTPAIREIRKTNPTRPIIVAGNYGSNVPSLASLDIAMDDPNLIPTFHFYDPMAFTHQGADWTTLRYPLGRPLSDSDRADIDLAVTRVKDYMNRTGRVPFLGEYGAFDMAGIDVADRVQYYGLVSSAFASVGVQSCAWSFTNGFSLYTNAGWIPGMLDAVQTTTTLMPL